MLEYYDKPRLLEDRIKEHTRANFADKKYVDSVNMNKFNWHDDLVKLVNRWIADQPKDYEIIDKWCSAIDYALIKEGHFRAQYPEERPVSGHPDDPFSGSVIQTLTIGFAPH